MDDPNREITTSGPITTSEASNQVTTASALREGESLKLTSSRYKNRSPYKNRSRQTSLINSSVSADHLHNNSTGYSTEDDFSEDKSVQNCSASGDEDSEYIDDKGNDYQQPDGYDEPSEDEVDEDNLGNYKVQNSRSKRTKRSPSFDLDPHEPDGPMHKDVSKPRGGKVEKPNSSRYKIGVQEHLKPIHKIPDIFADMIENALKVGLDGFLRHLKGRKLKVATMCSGTESPILALQLFDEALKKKHKSAFEIEHLFSAEIVPFKQAYIERNFSPPILFRDIKELARKGATEATTAYGSRAVIPGGVDLLVTGFSCVDFSALNNKKKRLEAEGESGDTFFSLRKYALRFRPKMIVVENVSTAPWDNIQKEFRKIGYHSYFQRLDTKNFYIPHTRVRGYIICVDRHLYGLTRDSKPAHGQQMLNSALKKMKEVLKALERPASSTVEAFSLAEDDPRVQLARDELSNSTRSDKGRSTVVDWTRCHTRHEAERTNQCLGQMRPMTQWQDGGSCKPVDFMWRDWTQAQVSRVLDTIDLSFLRNLKRGFDQRYKVRVLDLSQNVDRNTDTTGAGITGCLTPSGIPWNTMRGGPLVGIESLALQGLPIDRLQLSHEKQSQLQDLAGNAMSSPVVGAAILAILIAGYHILPQGQAGKDDPGILYPLVREMHEENLVSFNVNITDYDPLSVTRLLDLARKSFRLCLCEGRSFVTKLRLQKCSSCMHTTCERCGGNPCHEKYESLNNEIIAQRILPSEFEDIIKGAIPMKTQVVGVTDKHLEKVFSENPKNISLEDWKTYICRVQKAFGSELRFKSVRRSEVWTVFFDSSHARSELIIDSCKVQWLFFGKPSDTEPVNSRIRKLLSHPIARMNPGPHDITRGSWELWFPKICEVKASFRSHGELTSSFEGIMGLGRSLDTFVWSNCTISIPERDAKYLDEDIRGTYRLLQNCGAAEGSLHVKIGTEASSAPLFFFLDPDRVRNPKDDYFVFSTDKRRLTHDETRQVVARVEPNWRPPKIGKENTVGEIVNTAKIFVDGRWIQLHHARFNETASKRDESFSHAPANLEILDIHDLSVQYPCQSHVAVLSCKATYPEGEYTRHMGDRWREIDTVEQKEFFTEFAWLMQRARDIPGLDNWREIPSYTPHPCFLCAPAPPGIKWKLVTEQKKGKQNTGLVPFENPREAADFEAALKKRVSPLITQVRMDSTGLVQLKIGFSPVTLIHRAVAKLLSSLNVQLEVSWRLVTNDTTVTKLSLPKFEKLKGNDDDNPAEDPPGFKLKLRPEQLRSLGWMLKQEAAEVEPFIEEEVEECLIPNLGWRGEGRARRPVRVQGGLLADDVGFGKTATILGLIDTQRERDATAAKDPVKGRIRVKATLIMVPHHLCDQWRREIDKFTDASQKYNILVIKNLHALRDCTIEQFKSADVIIASIKFCDDEEYLLMIAQFAGVVKLPKSSPWRATCTWYQDTLNLIPPLINELKTGGAGVAAMARENLLASRKRAKSEEFFAPSKRLRGQAYQNAKVIWVGRQKKKPAFEVTEPTTSKRKRSSLAKKDPQDTDSEDDTDVEDAESQEPDIEKAKGKTRDFQQPVYRGKESIAGSKRKRANSQDTAAEDDIDLNEIESQESDSRKTESKRSGIRSRTDPFGLSQIAKGRKSWVLMNCPLFELFEFSRLVVDEYTYVTGQESLTVSNIKANSRWILSATPSLKDFADVKSIAGFLGINLGVDDFANGVVQAATVKRMLKDRTDAEEFRSFKECHSAAWHKNRNSVAQRFLDYFVRKNVPKIGDIKFTEHIIPVILPPAEQAIYLELQQLLACSDFKMKKRKVNNSNDRERRIKELLGNSESSGEALIKSASHFTLGDANASFASANEACDALVELREKQLAAMKDELHRKAEQAEWLYRNCGMPTKHFKDWKSKTSHNGFGDPKALSLIKEIIDAIYHGYSDNDWKRFYSGPRQMAKSKVVKGSNNQMREDTDDEQPALPLLPADDNSKDSAQPRQMELRNVVNELHKKSDELIARCRSLRFLETIRALQKSLDGGCSCGNCGKKNLPPEEVFVLQQCGHVLCNMCLAPHAGRHLQCLVMHCHAHNRPHEIFPAKSLCINVESSHIGRRYGQKIGEVVQLVESIPEDEQALLFVQFEDLMAKFAEAFGESGIGYAKLTGQGNASKILEDFQTNKSKIRKKVLLLNMGDETASGSNLTNANHVIFTSPYLAWSPHDYQQSIVQAKGRSIRYGQTKHVHIYHFLSLRTIDVDIVQNRSGQILAKTPDGELEAPFRQFKQSGLGLVGAKGETDVGEFSSSIFGMMAVDLEND